MPRRSRDPRIPTAKTIIGRRDEHADDPLCPQADQHTPAPLGYLAWHEWAEEMAKTHKTKRCPGCGLYKIWIPTVARRAALERTDDHA